MHFSISRLLKRYDTGAPRVQMLHKAFDCAAFAGGITAFEYGHDSLVSLLGPTLRFQQFNLKLLLLPFELLGLEFFLARIFSIAKFFTASHVCARVSMGYQFDDRISPNNIKDGVILWKA